jgi:NitT/TauT family transport system substrate-binding protein
VSFRLNFNPNAEHAPYYLGKKKGFYQEAGIDLDILPGTGSAVTVKLVGSGDSNFGVAVADAVTVGRAQNIPVVSTAALLQRSPTVLVAKKESGIAKPTDLYGKNVGVNPQSTVYAFWIAFTKVNNIDRSRINEINVTGSAVGPFVAGTFDAVGLLLTNEVVTVRNQGIELNIMDYSDFGVKSYGQVVFTNDNYLRDNRDVAKRVSEATVRSWEYTLSNVDEAIDALAEAVPETDKTLEKAKWGPITELVRAPSPAGSPAKIGEQALPSWELTYETFKNGGLIEQDFDVKTLFAVL